MHFTEIQGNAQCITKQYNVIGYRLQCTAMHVMAITNQMSSTINCGVQCGVHCGVHLDVPLFIPRMPLMQNLQTELPTGILVLKESVSKYLDFLHGRHVWNG